MKGQASLEWLLVLLAYFALAAALSLGFKDFSSKVSLLEKNALDNRLAQQECFFEELFFLNARNAAFPVGQACLVERENSEPS